MTIPSVEPLKSKGKNLLTRVRVVRSRRRFRMVLDAHRFHGREDHARTRAVVQINVRHLDAVGQRVRVHRIVVVLRR